MHALRTVAEAYRDKMIRKRLTWLAQRLRDDAVPPAAPESGGLLDESVERR
jgi:hypothetical protein